MANLTTPAARLADRRERGLTLGNKPLTIAEEIWAIAQDDLAAAGERLLNTDPVVKDRRSQTVTRYGFADGSRIDVSPSGFSIA